MAHRVVWSPAALEDVDSTAAFIARDSSHYAAAVVRRILQGAATHEPSPRPGAVFLALARALLPHSALRAMCGRASAQLPGTGAAARA